MIEYLFKNKVHYFFIRHGFILNFQIFQDDIFGCSIYIFYQSFITKKVEVFSKFLEVDIEDLHNIFVREVSDEVSHGI